MCDECFSVLLGECSFGKQLQNKSRCGPRARICWHMLCLGIRRVDFFKKLRIFKIKFYQKWLKKKTKTLKLHILCLGINLTGMAGAQKKGLRTVHFRVDIIDAPKPKVNAFSLIPLRQSTSQPFWAIWCVFACRMISLTKSLYACSGFILIPNHLNY